MSYHDKPLADRMAETDAVTQPMRAEKLLAEGANEIRRLTGYAEQLMDDVRVVLRGFDEGAFIRDAAMDASSDWAMKLFPYIAALGRLAALAKNPNPSGVDGGATGHSAAKPPEPEGAGLQPCSSMADPDAVAEYWRGRELPSQSSERTIMEIASEFSDAMWRQGWSEAEKVEHLLAMRAVRLLRLTQLNAPGSIINTEIELVTKAVAMLRPREVNEIFRNGDSNAPPVVGNR